MTAATITDPFAHWAASLHHADPVGFQHIAEETESLPPSPLVLRMRAAVDAERALRREAIKEEFRAALRAMRERNAVDAERAARNEVAVQ